MPAFPKVAAAVPHHKYTRRPSGTRCRGGGAGHRGSDPVVYILAPSIGAFFWRTWTRLESRKTTCSKRFAGGSVALSCAPRGPRGIHGLSPQSEAPESRQPKCPWRGPVQHDSCSSVGCPTVHAIRWQRHPAARSGGGGGGTKTPPPHTPPTAPLQKGMRVLKGSEQASHCSGIMGSVLHKPAPGVHEGWWWGGGGWEVARGCCICTAMCWGTLGCPYPPSCPPWTLPAAPALQSPSLAPPPPSPPLHFGPSPRCI